MIKISYTFDKDGTDKGVGMEAETILDALALVDWLKALGYYNVTMKREESVTVAELIELLKTQPQDAKVLIEDFVTEAWERENDEGTAQEHVLMLTTYKEEE